MSDKDIYRLITSQNIATSMVFKISLRRFNIEIACRSIVDTEILKRVSQRHPSLIKSLSFTPKSVPIVYQSSSEFLRQSVLITPRCRLKIITVFQTMIPNFLATNIQIIRIQELVNSHSALSIDKKSNMMVYSFNLNVVA